VFSELDRLSESSDVLRPWAFRPLSRCVAHTLSFVEFFEANSVEVGHVEEHVTTVPRVDESKTLFRQLLDRAFSH
jgi:hypothetical protein